MLTQCSSVLYRDPYAAPLVQPHTMGNPGQIVVAVDHRQGIQSRPPGHTVSELTLSSECAIMGPRLSYPWSANDVQARLRRLLCTLLSLD